MIGQTQPVCVFSWCWTSSHKQTMQGLMCVYIVLHPDSITQAEEGFWGGPSSTAQLAKGPIRRSKTKHYHKSPVVGARRSGRLISDTPTTAPSTHSPIKTPLGSVVISTWFFLAMRSIITLDLL